MKSAKTLTIVLAIFIGTTLFGQGKLLLEEKNGEIIGPKTTTGLNLGASYMTGFGGSSLFSQSISPFVKHNISSRFSLIAGTEISLFQFSSPMMPFSPVGATSLSASSLPKTGFFGATAFVAGEFKASDRISLFGSSWVNYNNMPLHLNASSIESYNHFSRGFSMNLEYRVSSSFSIGAGMSISNKKNPFMMQQGFGNYQNPFFLGPVW